MIEAVPELQFGNAFPTFVAGIKDPTVLTYDRVIYPADRGAADNVYWDTWNEDFDRRFFDIDDYHVTIDGQDTIAGLALLVPGVYSIVARVDFDQDFTGTVELGSNYDDGRRSTYDHFGGVTGDVRPDSLHQFRYLWEAQFTEFDIEIVVCHDADVGDLTIPGGDAGEWGVIPLLFVSYLGAATVPPDWANECDWLGLC